MQWPPVMSSEIIRSLSLALVTVVRVPFANVTRNIEMGGCLGLQTRLSSYRALRREREGRGEAEEGWVWPPAKE